MEEVRQAWSPGSHRTTQRDVIFLGLVLLFSIPFYLLGAFLPVAGLPFDLPISALMIIVPLVLGIVFTARARGRQGVSALFRSVTDVSRARPRSLLIGCLAMPAATALTYVTTLVVGLPLPEDAVNPMPLLAPMLLVYFIGAIPEEIGWTATVTAPLSRQWGPVAAGAVIGLVWGLWHVIPWLWTHPPGWVFGMLVLSILMRILMTLIFVHGGQSLFVAILFHALINTSIGAFPNNGSHLSPWILCLWVAVILALVLSARTLRRSTRIAPTPGPWRVPNRCMRQDGPGQALLGSLRRSGGRRK